MPHRLFHGDFLGAFCQKGAHLSVVDILKGDDEVGGEPFYGVDEKDGGIGIVIFDPERNYFLKAVHRIVDRDAAVGYLKINQRGRRLCEKSERDCGNENNDCEEKVAQKDADERG